MRLVFVAGLTHSGSTVLDLLLGAHSKLIGIGEAATLVTQHLEKLRERDRRCSCGLLLSECTFWSRIVVDEYVGASPAERYRRLLATFSSTFGPDRIPVDSSKSLATLRLVSTLENVDVRVVHLIRDVRAWLVSRVEVDKRHRSEGLARIKAEYPRGLWFYYMQRLAVVRFAIWHRGNRLIREFAADRGIPWFEVSYEELALNGSALMKPLCDFLGVASEPLISEIATSDSHVALGNPMRLDARRKTAIVYDYRWLSRPEWVLASLLMPHVMAYNRSHVYPARTWPVARSEAATSIGGNGANFKPWA